MAASEKRKMRFYVSEVELILALCAVAALFVHPLILCMFIHRKVCSDVHNVGHGAYCAHHSHLRDFDNLHMGHWDKPMSRQSETGH